MEDLSAQIRPVSLHTEGVLSNKCRSKDASSQKKAALFAFFADTM